MPANEPRRGAAPLGRGVTQVNSCAVRHRSELSGGGKGQRRAGERLRHQSQSEAVVPVDFQRKDAKTQRARSAPPPPRPAERIALSEGSKVIPLRGIFASSRLCVQK